MEPDEPLPDHSLVRRAATLDDYLGEEVVDEQGKLLGTLSCYWEAADGRLVFCGIQMADQDGVRVAPGNGAQISERHSWVRVACPASKARTAPVFGCEHELDGELERAVYDHYGIQPLDPPHKGLKYLGSRG
jgi:hypothetical protein